MSRKAALGLTFVRFLMSINQANQWWFPLRNTSFHITGIWVSWDKNIQEIANSLSLIYIFIADSICIEVMLDCSPERFHLLIKGLKDHDWSAVLQLWIDEKEENKIDTSNTSKQYTIEELLEVRKEKSYLNSWDVRKK